MRYVLGETLQEYQEEIMEKDRPSVFLATSQTARDCLEQAGMQYEGEINLKDVGFCKMETQQECFAGSLCIPKLLDILGERYKILFFINRHHIVIVDDDEFSYRLIRRIKRKKTRQGESKEKFIYNFMLEFIAGIWNFWDIMRNGSWIWKKVSWTERSRDSRMRSCRSDVNF